MSDDLYHYKCLGCGREIDLNQYHAYGWICKKCRKQGIKLPVKCSECHCDMIIHWRTYQRKRKDESWKCDKCNNKHRSENQSKFFKNMSYEEILEYMQPARDGYKKSLIEISDEERKRLYNIRSIINKRQWENLTPEEKLEKQKPRIEGFDKWKNASYLDKVRRDFKYVIEYNNKSNKEKLHRIKKDSNEYNFMNLLDAYEIEYKIYYYNTKVFNYGPFDINGCNEFPDFRRIFIENKFIGSNYVSPFHEWDFAIIKDNKFYMFIDVDGSIHDSLQTNYEVTNNNKKIKYNLSQFIHFYDSQRLYQTDGYSSYIVKCYNDIINNDTLIYNMQLNIYCNLIDFLIKLRKYMNNIIYRG